MFNDKTLRRFSIQNGRLDRSLQSRPYRRNEAVRKCARPIFLRKSIEFIFFREDYITIQA
jgi:hypothetical protein